jgi:hypothetical protein
MGANLATFQTCVNDYFAGGGIILSPGISGIVLREAALRWNCPRVQAKRVRVLFFTERRAYLHGLVFFHLDILLVELVARFFNINSVLADGDARENRGR